jgi:hypothetical protein
MNHALRILALSLLATVAVAGAAAAQGRTETLIVITESGPNSMDIHGIGTNRQAYQASWNLYDRLMTYGVKTAAGECQVRSTLPDSFLVVHRGR